MRAGCALLPRLVPLLMVILVPVIHLSSQSTRFSRVCCQVVEIRGCQIRRRGNNLWVTYWHLILELLMVIPTRFEKVVGSLAFRITDQGRNDEWHGVSLCVQGLQINHIVLHFVSHILYGLQVLDGHQLLVSAFWVLACSLPAIVSCGFWLIVALDLKGRSRLIG